MSISSKISIQQEKQNSQVIITKSTQQMKYQLKLLLANQTLQASRDYVSTLPQMNQQQNYKDLIVLKTITIHQKQLIIKQTTYLVTSLSHQQSMTISSQMNIPLSKDKDSQTQISMMTILESQILTKITFQLHIHMKKSMKMEHSSLQV